MLETNQIRALLHLLDDPDENVYETVRSKIMAYGRDVIPNLEAEWETTLDNTVQLRIEELIHDVNYEVLASELAQWTVTPGNNLFEALLICCKYKYPDAQEDVLRKKMKDIRQSIWLELNQYLTPLEQANILASIFYNYYRFSYEEPTPERIDICFVNVALQSCVGSSHVLGILLVDLAHSLDIPLFAVNMPNVFLLGYVDHKHKLFSTEVSTNNKRDILFYIDPSSGSIFTQQDIDAYLKKNEYEIQDKYFEVLSNKQILRSYLKQLLQLYKSDQFINNHEKEILHLIDIIKRSE